MQKEIKELDEEDDEDYVDESGIKVELNAP